VSSATNSLSDDSFLRKLRAARKILDGAETSLRRAEAAACPIFYLDLHRPATKAVAKSHAIRLAG
jgi:hypothetical protein